MVELLRDGKLSIFMVDWRLVNTAVFEATVHEVTSWNTDNSVRETEKYLSATIKWDGCSHVTFGDEDGYIHICGENSWKNHIRVMEALLDLAKSNLKSWDGGS